MKLLTSIFICEGIGLLSSLFTFPSIQNWYSTLYKPSFSPPNWVFGPVWTVLYAMMGISEYLIWKKGVKQKKVKTALLYFLLQLILNYLWSMLFFGLHSPFLALIDIVLLWTAIAVTIAQFHRISKPASYLLIPYLLWVSFALELNLAIVMLNT